MTENKRFTYSDVWGWNVDGFLNVMNGLDRKNNELKEQIKELKSENKMLKTTISRNEAYIKRITTKGKWSNTSDMK